MSTGATLAFSGSVGSSPPSHNSSPPVLGLQLFTVWAALEHDFEGTLRAVAAMGYKQVETLGAFGRDPLRVREALDRCGLVSPSQHLAPNDLYPLFRAYEQGRVPVQEVLQRVVDGMPVDRMNIIVEEGISRARVLGQRYVIWGMTATDQMATPASLDSFCKALNAAGRLCASEGMLLGIHNHDSEFKPVNGYVPYDVIIQNTDPKTVTFELDVCWATAGGADPAAYIARYPDRFRQLHLKDYDGKGGVAIPGKGVVNFPSVLQAARQSGVEHYYVEHDHAADPLATASHDHDYFRKLMA